jgi:hypothetical protein
MTGKSESFFAGLGGIFRGCFTAENAENAEKKGVWIDDGPAHGWRG